jgi:hypothetical protein
MRPVKEQLETFKRIFDGREFARTHPTFQAVLDFARTFPGKMSPEEIIELRSMICRTFTLEPEELDAHLAGTTIRTRELNERQQLNAKQIEDELWSLLPLGGFLHRYAEYTRHSEAPLAYHVYCGLVGLGVTLNRRVWFDMGYYRLYPSLGVLILGPSGIKKTSAANIIVSMLAELQLNKIYGEKLTPEALVEAMKTHAQGLIYAPEMAVFLGRQRYNEGLVPLITRLMDCPDIWTVETIGRGGTTLRDVAVSCLMCSTLDWFISNTPEDTFGGGFIARNIMVVQNASPRIEPIPKPGDSNLRQRLMEELARLHEFQGEMILSEVALRRYKEWYHEHKVVSVNPEHELLATYFQRKPDHIKRIAMLIHLSEHKDLTICHECFDRSVALLDWTDKFLPGMLTEMFKTQVGQEQAYVLKVIETTGGVIKHSDLVRKVQYRMSASQLKAILGSLKEADRIIETQNQLVHAYSLKED